MECFVELLSKTPRGKLVSTHVTADVFEHIRLERHVHIDSPNDQTKLPLDHVQYSWDKFRRSFSKVE